MHTQKDDYRRHQDGTCCNDAGHCPGCANALREDDEREEQRRQQQRQAAEEDA